MPSPYRHLCIEGAAMRGTISVVRVQFSRLLAKKEFWFALTISVVIFSVAFVELCAHFLGSDRGAIPSAATAWVANMDNLLIFSIHLYFFLIIFILSSMAFGDAALLDFRSRQVEHFLSRCSARTYIVSTALVAFAAGFLVVAIPLSLFQVLSFVVFPAFSDPWSFSGNLLSTLQDYTWIRLNARGALFFDLMYEMPYVYNLIFILYDSIWGGLSAVVSVALSCCIRKSRLFVVGAPTFLYLLVFFLFGGMLPLQYYLYPNTLYVPLSMPFFVIAPIAVGLSAFAVILAKSSKRGDLLL